MDKKAIFDFGEGEESDSAAYDVVGTLTPTFVAQESLAILADRFAIITTFTTDFSEQPVLFGQTFHPRLPQVQGVQNYDTTIGYVASAGPHGLGAAIRRLRAAEAAAHGPISSHPKFALSHEACSAFLSLSLWNTS